MRILVSFLSVFSLLLSCKSSKKDQFNVQQIIDASMIASGVYNVSNATICFEFREKAYKASRKSGVFQLERTSFLAHDTIQDIVSNSGFKRLINNYPVEISDSLKTIYSNALNSVHYFAVLPFGLNDAAVQKKLLPNVLLNKKTYYKIEVRFNEQGGGSDFEDVFVYWIDAQTYLISYLAYSFHVNGGGLRFRSVKSSQIIKGIRFVDYDNYSPVNEEIALVDLDVAFEKNQLKKISEIILEKVRVDFVN